MACPASMLHPPIQPNTLEGGYRYDNGCQIGLKKYIIDVNIYERVPSLRSGTCGFSSGNLF